LNEAGTAEALGLDAVADEAAEDDVSLLVGVTAAVVALVAFGSAFEHPVNTSTPSSPSTPIRAARLTPSPAEQPDQDC
jgi:hypothetical protein